jgi:hypothetical protein
MITVTMACGHTQQLVDGSVPPFCGQCRETRVSHVKAPKPRFRGVVQGPCAEFEALKAQPVTLRENT